MDVPSDPGSANCDQNDDPRPQKWRPQASKMPGLSFQLTSSHRSTNEQWGGRRQGAKPLRNMPRQALACRRRREGVSAKGPNLSRRESWGLRLCRRPSPERSKIMLFLTCSKNPKKVRKLPPKGRPNGARNLKNPQKMPSGCLLKSKLEKKTEIVRILTPSNLLKRAKTNTKTPFSRFHPDTKKSPK